jgi:DNA-binding NarL/FixJ family response regulator
MPITVSIVEDNRGTRENLVALLECAPGLRVLHSYPNGEEAVRGILKDVPGVVLMDIQLPGMNGIQCVAQVKAKLPNVQVLMLTTYEDSDLIFESLRAGANGYLLKNMPPSEMIQAIEQVHAGGSPMSMHIARKVVNHFQPNNPAPSEVDQLTKREHEILGLLAKGQPYKEIADHLQISVNTVRVHLHSVYEKLHVQSRTEAVVKFLRR